MKIKRLWAKKILDSRGNWTIATSVELTSGLRAEAAVPQGKSSGSFEAVFVNPEAAVRHTAKLISPSLCGFSIDDQIRIDNTLRQLDGTKTKKRLGANAILGASLACARAAAQATKKPLWQYLREMSCLSAGQIHKPKLFANVINGGLHADNNLDFQEYIVIPLGSNYTRSVSLLLEFYRELGIYLKKDFGPGATGVGDEGGFAPKFRDNLHPFQVMTLIIKKMGYSRKFAFGLDAAASNVKIPVPQLFTLYKQMINDFPLFFLEDGFEENDFKSFTQLTQLAGKQVWIAGDDLTTTNSERMKMAKEANSINAVIIKPNQIGTLSETLDAIRLARKFHWRVVVSHRSGETNDDFLSDLAYGVGADGIKLGGPARGERIAKYNRLLEIETENNYLKKVEK